MVGTWSWKHAMFGSTSLCFLVHVLSSIILQELKHKDHSRRFHVCRWSHINKRLFSFIGQNLSGRPSPHFPPEPHPDPSQRKWSLYFLLQGLHRRRSSFSSPIEWILKELRSSQIGRSSLHSNTWFGCCFCWGMTWYHFPHDLVASKGPTGCLPQVNPPCSPPHRHQRWQGEVWLRQQQQLHVAREDLLLGRVFGVNICGSSLMLG